MTDFCPQADVQQCQRELAASRAEVGRLRRAAAAATQSCIDSAASCAAAAAAKAEEELTAAKATLATKTRLIRDLQSRVRFAGNTVSPSVVQVDFIEEVS